MEYTKVNCPMQTGISTDNCGENCPWRTTAKTGDLISRKIILEALGHFNDYINGDRHFLNGIETAKEIVENLPAADAVAVVYGQWKRFGPDGIVCCSICGMPMIKTHVSQPDGGNGYYYIATKYCPHCGAKNEKGDCDG